MKISSTSSSRKRILIISILAVAALGAAAFALEKTGVINFIDNDQSYAGPTKEQQQEQKQTELDQKKDFIESPDPSPNSETTSSASIELSAKQEGNGSVTVLTKLYSVSNGTCALNITNGSKAFADSAQVIYQPSFSSCAGFSIAKDKLGSGIWSINLSVNSDPTLTKTITLQVN